jgi:hypothetical protein
MSFLLLLALQDFAFDPWESWNAFKAGASVEYEIEDVAGKKTLSKTIELKEDASIRLKTLLQRKVRGVPMQEPGTEEIAKKAAAPPECPQCRKAHTPQVKQSKEKVKTAAGEIDCVLVQTTPIDCKGQATGTASKAWYSRSVPGWLVRSESGTGDAKVTVIVAAFERK